VDAFVWGSLRTAKQIACDLLPHQGMFEQKRLQRILARQLEQLGMTDPSALIYHQEFIGALEAVRNLSLVRSLFARMCQFALDHRIEYVVTATIPTVNAYTLLRSIGMEVVYSYPLLEASAQIVPIEQREEIMLGNGMTTSLRSALDEAGVILGGSVHTLLKQLSLQSDRTLFSQILRYMKQEKTAHSGSRG
jgi:hypothetical protein